MKVPHAATFFAPYNHLRQSYRVNDAALTSFTCNSKIAGRSLATKATMLRGVAWALAATCMLSGWHPEKSPVFWNGEISVLPSRRRPLLLGTNSKQKNLGLRPVVNA